MKTTPALRTSLLLICASLSALAQTYQKPSREILDILDAPMPPSAFVSPRGNVILFATPLRYPPISDLAEPMLRLAGLRINPRNNCPHGAFYWSRLTLKKLPDGAETGIALPPGLRVGGGIRWNATGTRVALAGITENAVELWTLDVAANQVSRIAGVQINPLLGSPMSWMPDQETLIVKLVPASRGAAPVAPSVPPGPRIQESSGAGAASSTYEVRDVLKNPHDEDLFDYYTASQLALVHVPSGRVTPIGKPAVYASAEPSPGGQQLLVERLHRPYSYLRTASRFPKEVEIWSRAGDLIETLASLPLADQVPIRGVPTGPRDHFWKPAESSTLVWAEALDEGNPKKKAAFRDRVLVKRLGGQPVELCKTEQRFISADWIENSPLVLVSEYDPDRRWNRTWLRNGEDPSVTPRVLWDMSADDRYKHPGSAVYHVLPTGDSAILQRDGWIYLQGTGSSPEGDRPFLDRLNLATFKTERLFRCDRASYEYFVDWMDVTAGNFLTRHETPATPPNFSIRTLAGPRSGEATPGEAAWSSASRFITHLPDPAPRLREIKKERVTYKREDGVALSFTLYLPPGYKPGTRLPTVFWAYPLDYVEKDVAGQIEGSTQHFTTLSGSSQLFFLLQGYAVLDDVAMPVIGPPETVYDTMIEQLVSDARAAIAKAAELGVTDPGRVGVAGHSHGALMTANLLAHSDLFRAGIARSGAYNKTLTAFGFQNERRTLWQARDAYVRVSPTLHAEKIKAPLLLIHGELDANPGTVPLQSEKFYEALRGVGATTRLVMLPFENHGYRARESTEHVLYEMISWFDKYVKNANPQVTK